MYICILVSFNNINVTQVTDTVKTFGLLPRLRIDFGLILLILNMIIHRSFTGPTWFLSANVPGPVSSRVSEVTKVYSQGRKNTNLLPVYIMSVNDLFKTKIQGISMNNANPVSPQHSRSYKWLG